MLELLRADAAFYAANAAELLAKGEEAQANLSLSIQYDIERRIAHIERIAAERG